MGDRRMAEIRNADGSLYVYTHSAGYDLPARAVEAIRWAKPRWNDHSYAMRMIVDQLTKPGRDQELGYGLLLTPKAEDEYNNDQPSVVIDLVARELTVSDIYKTVKHTFAEVIS